MAITTDDFNKIWASTSPLTPYSFSDSQYKEGWNFIGSTPPARQMWDFLQKQNDEKMQYLANNYLPLNGGTLTGVVNGVTPTAGDNSTKIATTEFVNAKAGNYLPLNGGTMTGNIQWGVGSNGTHFGIQPSAKGCDFGWWWNELSGAGLGLRNVSHRNSGQFNLWATDGTTTKALVGNPDGTLTWDGKEIERVNASGTDYIRYESGIQICWGETTNITSVTTVTITFPVAFKAHDSYGISIGRWWASSSTENYYLSDRTATSIKLTTIGTAPASGHFYYYVAVGYWK